MKLMIKSARNLYIEKGTILATNIIVVLVGLVLSFVFNNTSIVLFSLFSWWTILFFNMTINKDERSSYYTFLLVSWLVLLGSMLFIYLAENINYGVPYIMSDDYSLDTDWAPGVIEHGYYTVEQMNKSGIYFYANANCKLYILFLAYVQRFGNLLGGYHTIDIRLLNMSSVIASSLIVNRLGINNYGFDFNATKKLLRILIFLPNIMYLCGHVYRDTYVMFFLVSLFYIWNIRGVRKNKLFNIITTVVLFYCIYYNRMFAVVYAALIVFLALYTNKNKEKIISHMITPTRFFLCIIAILSAAFLLNYLSGNSAFYNNYIIGYTTINTQGGGISSIAYNMSIFPFGWLARCFVFLVSPFYSQIIGLPVFGNVLDLVYFFQTAGTCFLFFVYIYWLKSLKRLDSLAIINIVLFVSCAVITSGFRHILMVYPFMFLGAYNEYNSTDAHLRNKYFKYSAIILLLWLLIYTGSRFI